MSQTQCLRFLTLAMVTAVCMAPADAFDCIDFSIDQASPEYLAPPFYDSSADVLHTSFTGFYWVRRNAESLGLLETDDIDAYSEGHDLFLAGGPGAWFVFMYSVDRASIGLAGSPVEAQSGGDGAASDIFWCPVDSNGICWWDTVYLRSNGPMHGLTALPPVQSDVDALNYYWTFRTNAGAYFSVVGSGDILCQPELGPGAPPPVVFARAVEDLGLQPSDDVDALNLRKLFWSTPCVLDPLDVIYISLTPDSPSAGGPDGFGAATVIQVHPGAPQVVIAAADLGLRDDDNLNAMTLFDPCPVEITFSGINQAVIEVPENCGESFDIASGLLSDLRASGGDFSGVSWSACDYVGTTFDVSGSPAIDDGFYYVVRRDGSTWNGFGEIEDRDATLSACP